MIVRVSLEASSNNDGVRPNRQPSSHDTLGVETPIPFIQDKGFRICIRTIQILILAGCFSFQQTLFNQDGWSVKCDYDLKVWATTTLTAMILHATLASTRSIWPQLSIPGPLDPRRAVRIISRIVSGLSLALSLFQLAWFIRGALLLFVMDSSFDADTCGHGAWIWSLALWSWQALIYFTPCILVILIVPCVMCWLVFIRNPNELAGRRTPEEILNKLPKKRYADVVTEGIGRPVVNPNATSAENTTSGLNRSTTGGIFNALPDVMGVTHFLTRLGSTTGSGAHRSNERLAMMNNENMCAICVCEFEADDTVIQLPCDNRHIYHDSCLTEWLARSQQCPMCRQNVVDLVDEIGNP